MQRMRRERLNAAAGWACRDTRKYLANFDSHGSMPVRRRITVLLAEDNPGDITLVREALRLKQFDFDLAVEYDGEAMLKTIDQIASGARKCPDIFLLDINLPKWTGEKLLERIRTAGICKGVPVVMVTSSDSPRDRDNAQRLGASAYFRKPSDYDEFMKLGELIRQLLA